MSDSNHSPQPSRRGFLIVILSLLAVLLVLFFRSFQPEQILFANDQPLGALHNTSAWLPETITGWWTDSNWLGGETPSAAPTFSTLARLVFGTLNFTKFYAPTCLFALGLSAWFCFRQMRFSAAVCVLGALAAVLNANFFSNMCWGQASRPLSLAGTFLALGALQSSRSTWIKAMLAGLAVGLGVVEAFDVGAIFSLYVSAFILFYHFISADKIALKLSKGFFRLAIVAIFAGLASFQTVQSLVNTQVKGIVGTQQDAETKQARWSEATQWSTPKMELLDVIIAGLHGYRMDAPNGSQYWGSVGQSPGWVENHNKPDYEGGTARFVGSGEYAGLLVVLLAVYALCQTLRRQNNPFSAAERKLIFFWVAMGFVSLLLAFGRHAPFYKIVYQLPYFSTIRNPMKFMHPFHLCLMFLFVYGLQALFRQHVEANISKASSFKAQWIKWRSASSPFETKWTMGLCAVIGLSVLGFLIYSSSTKNLQAHLQNVGFSPEIAVMTAGYSISRVGLFIFFLILSSAAILAIMTGWFSGHRAKGAGLLLGIVLAIDLIQADKPWVIYWDYKDKYASNPIIDFLKEKPYDHRVTMLPVNHPDMGLLSSLYSIEWAQHLFLYYNIQSLDIIQMPRQAVDFAAYAGTDGVFPPHIVAKKPRYWELTNTRYLLGIAGMADAFNTQLDKGRGRFRTHTTFDLVPKAGRTRVEHYDDFTAVPNPNGKYSLIEFTGALPRVQLYSNWLISTNDQFVLGELPRPEFNPHQTVIVSKDSSNFPIPAASSATNQVAGKVEFVSYAPKRIEFNTEIPAESGPQVLLFNDRYDPKWRVKVDGKPETMLRCNYIVRGVYLEPGKHEVIFEFEPQLKGLYVSSSALGVGFLLCGFLIVSSRKASAETENKSAATSKADFTKA